MSKAEAQVSARSFDPEDMTVETSKDCRDPCQNPTGKDFSSFLQTVISVWPAMVHLQTEMSSARAHSSLVKRKRVTRVS